MKPLREEAMKFNVTVHLEHISGPELDEETMLDAFAAAVGRDNAAQPPLTLIAQGDIDQDESTYVVSLIDG